MGRSVPAAAHDSAAVELELERRAVMKSAISGSQPMERCFSGESHDQFDPALVDLVPRSFCGRLTKHGGRCSVRAGKGTDHVGYGPCSDHGGVAWRLPQTVLRIQDRQAITREQVSLMLRNCDRAVDAALGGAGPFSTCTPGELRAQLEQQGRVFTVVNGELVIGGCCTEMNDHQRAAVGRLFGGILDHVRRYPDLNGALDIQSGAFD